MYAVTPERVIYFIWFARLISGCVPLVVFLRFGEIADRKVTDIADDARGWRMENGDSLEWWKAFVVCFERWNIADDHMYEIIRVVGFPSILAESACYDRFVNSTELWHDSWLHQQWLTSSPEQLESRIIHFAYYTVDCVAVMNDAATKQQATP